MGNTFRACSCGLTGGCPNCRPVPYWPQIVWPLDNDGNNKSSEVIITYDEHILKLLNEMVEQFGLMYQILETLIKKLEEL